MRSLVLNPEIVHDLKEKFEDMKNKGEVQVEGNWKKFDAEAKEEKKQMKEAKKMEEIVEESSKILDDIDVDAWRKALTQEAEVRVSHGLFLLIFSFDCFLFYFVSSRRTAHKNFREKQVKTIWIDGIVRSI